MRAYFFSMIVNTATEIPPMIIKEITAGLPHGQDVPPKFRGIYEYANSWISRDFSL